MYIDELSDLSSFSSLKLLKKKVKLNIPSYLQSKGQFSIREAADTKKIEKLRIHVERAIRRIKEYHIFDSCIPLNMMGSINQIYTVICLLTNFQGALIKKNINNHSELSDDLLVQSIKVE